MTRYKTIEEINMDWKAEWDQLNLAEETKTNASGIIRKQINRTVLMNTPWQCCHSHNQSSVIHVAGHEYKWSFHHTLCLSQKPLLQHAADCRPMRQQRRLYGPAGEFRASTSQESALCLWALRKHSAVGRRGSEESDTINTEQHVQSVHMPTDYQR